MNWDDEDSRYVRRDACTDVSDDCAASNPPKRQYIYRAVSMIYYEIPVRFCQTTRRHATSVVVVRTTSLRGQMIVSWMRNNRGLFQGPAPEYKH